MIVLEATGGLERALVAELVAARLPVAVINPRQVRDFARSASNASGGLSNGVWPAQPSAADSARSHRRKAARTAHPCILPARAQGPWIIVAVVVGRRRGAG